MRTDQRERQEDRHRVVGAGLDLQRRADAVAERDAADAEQEEHRRGVGRRDDHAEEQALDPREAEDQAAPATPTSTAVITTPAVASASAGSAARRSVDRRVA